MIIYESISFRVLEKQNYALFLKTKSISCQFYENQSHDSFIKIDFMIVYENQFHVSFVKIKIMIVYQNRFHDNLRINFVSGFRKTKLCPFFKNKINFVSVL